MVPVCTLILPDTWILESARNLPQIGSPAVRGEDDGDRPVVHQLHVHHRAKSTGLGLEAPFPEKMGEALHQRFGYLGRCCPGEAGTPAAREVGVERELRND